MPQSRKAPRENYVRQVLDQVEKGKIDYNFAAGQPDPQVAWKQSIPGIAKGFFQLFESPEKLLHTVLGDEYLLPEDIVQDLKDRLNFHGGIERSINYGSTPGLKDLVSLIAKIETRRSGVDLGPDNIQILSGSQQGIDIFGYAYGADSCGSLLNIGMENPCYLGAHPTIRMHCRHLLPIPIDEYGIDTDALGKMLQIRRINALLTNPHAQNPSGATIPLSRRIEIHALSKEFDFMVGEDDPYWTTMASPLPPILSLDKEMKNTVLLRSFSKEGMNLRMAYAVGHPDEIAKFRGFKANMDLHNPVLIQSLFLDTLTAIEQNYPGGYIGYCQNVIAPFYTAKRSEFTNAMKDIMGDLVTWNDPTGGFFLWAKLPEGLDSIRVNEHLISEYRTAFVPGPAFAIKYGSQDSMMRLNFSYMKTEDYRPGLERLRCAVQDCLSMS